MKNIAILLCLLVISIPIVLAEEFNRVYDANGNLISDGKYYREYNGLNQLVRVRLGNTSTSLVLEEYKWHPIEERIVTKRIFNNGVYNYTIHYPNENIVVIVNSSGTFYEKYIYQEGTLVAQVNTDGQKQAIHSDHEGSNTLITASDGSVVENTLYSPYGEILEGGKSSRYGYEGKEYDSLTDDIDFKFRKFDPKIPIYGQPDDRIPNPYDPQQLNRYSFELNNPLKNIDEDGHLSKTLVAIGIFIYVYLTIYGNTILQSKEAEEKANKAHEAGYLLKDNQNAGEPKPKEAKNEKAIEPNYDFITETASINPEKIKIPEPKSLEPVIDDREEKQEEEIQLCEKCYKRLQVDERGQAVIVTFNEKGQEVSRSSSSGGGPGGGSTVRETDDDRWVCKWCDDQGNEMPIEQD